MATIGLVSDGDGWHGIYINGRLVTEGHSEGEANRLAHVLLEHDIIEHYEDVCLEPNEHGEVDFPLNWEELPQ